MNPTLRVGIVGCGGIARAHWRAYREAGAEVVAVYDTVPAAAEKFAAEAGAKAAPSPENLARAWKLDAVSICTPPGVHYDNCKPFLKKRLPILCEKPLGMTVTQAEEMIALCDRTGIKLGCAFMMRFVAQHQEALTLICQGRLVPAQQQSQRQDGSQEQGFPVQFGFHQISSFSVPQVSRHMRRTNILFKNACGE